MSSSYALHSEMYRQHKPIAVAYYNIYNQCTAAGYPIAPKYSKSHPDHLSTLIRHLSNAVLLTIQPTARKLYIDPADGLYCSFCLIKPELGMIDGNFALVEYHENRAMRKIDRASVPAGLGAPTEVDDESKDLDLVSGAETEAEAAAGKAAALLMMRIYDTMDARRLARKFGAWDRAKYKNEDDMPETFRTIRDMGCLGMIGKDVAEVGKRGADMTDELLALLSPDKNVSEAAFAGTPMICCRCTALVFEKGLCLDHLEELQ